MNSHLSAILEVHRFLSARRIPYAIIGGIAVQYWGMPRFTRDIDVTVLVTLGGERAFLEDFLASFRPRIVDALEFAVQHRICLAMSSEGHEIDVSLGIPGYEEEVITRAVECDFGGGTAFMICTAEDLIIHKAMAGRPQDLADIEGVVIRQVSALNTTYIRQWLQKLSLLLEDEEVLQRFERMLPQSTS